MRVHKIDRMLMLCCLASVMSAGCNGKPKELQIRPDHAYADARTLLIQSTEDPNPVVRTHALEALVSVESGLARGVIVQALKDDRLPVMAAAVLASGDIRFAGVKTELLAMASARDPAPPQKLMCALIYALHQLGDDTYTTELGRLLHHSDKYVRAEAARIMGKMGVPSAVGPLKSRQRDELDMAVRLNIAEALALLGDERSLAILEVFTKDEYLESRLIAIEGLGRLPHPRSVLVLQGITGNHKQDPLVRVAAAKSLARLGDTSGYDQAMAALARPRVVLERARGRDADIREMEVIALQAQAALALGQMKNRLAVDALHPLLSSNRGSVRVAAAQAIMNLLRGYRLAAPKAQPEPLPPDVKTVPKQPDTAPALLPPKLHTSGGKD